MQNMQLSQMIGAIASFKVLTSIAIFFFQIAKDLNQWTRFNRRDHDRNRQSQRSMIGRVDAAAKNDRDTLTAIRGEKLH